MRRERISPIGLDIGSRCVKAAQVALRAGGEAARVVAGACFARLEPDTPVSAREMERVAGALDRLGFATSGELKAYWNAITPEQARDWCRDALARGEVEEIGVEGADGKIRRAFCRPGTVDEAAALPPCHNRLRILSPFDPALRDRDRAERLFGFYYRIEVFVPEPQRLWGYYVFPVLEGERLIGRLDAKAHRDQSVLRVRAFWPERGVKPGPQRLTRLEAELDRLARFAGCDRVEYLPGWQRETLSRP